MKLFSLCPVIFPLVLKKPVSFNLTLSLTCPCPPNLLPRLQYVAPIASFVLAQCSPSSSLVQIWFCLRRVVPHNSSDHSDDRSNKYL